MNTKVLYQDMASDLKKIKEHYDHIKFLKKVHREAMRLKKKVPDLKIYISKHEWSEYRSEWVNKNWTHTTHGGGGCSTYYLRGYIIVDGIKIYSDYKVRLGYYDYELYNSEFQEHVNWIEAVEMMGDKIKSHIEEALKEYNNEW